MNRYGRGARFLHQLTEDESLIGLVPIQIKDTHMYVRPDSAHSIKTVLFPNY